MSSHLESFKNRSDLDLKNERQIIELNALFEVSNQLSSSLKLDEILNNTLFLIMGRMLISKAAILLQNDEKQYSVAHAKGVKLDSVITFSLEKEKPYCASEISDQNHECFISNKLDLIIPIKSKNGVIGLFILGKKLNKEPFETEEINFLDSVCMIAGASIVKARMFEELEQSNRALDQKIHQLETLGEVGQSLNSTLDFDDILRTLSRTLMGQFMCSSHGVLYFREGELKIALQKSITIEIATISYLSSIENANNIDISSLQCETLHIIPLVSQKIDGYLLIGKKLNNIAYTPDEIEFIENIANRTTAALSNAILLQEAIEKQKLEDEMNLAKKIQLGLLPKEMPSVDDYEIIGSNQTSKAVGGDYFDFINHSSDTLGIAIGDVSGKGAAAAMLMSNLQASMHAITVNRQIDITEQIAQANSIIYRNTTSDKYITFFYGELFSDENKFTYVNAGHNYPILVRNQEFIELKTGGLILGMMEGMPYSSETIELFPNDVLIMYTDGINEAMNDANDEEYGMDRFNEIILNTTHLSADEIHKEIIDDVFRFAPNANDSDDITLIVLKRK